MNGYLLLIKIVETMQELKGLICFLCNLQGTCRKGHLPEALLGMLYNLQADFHRGSWNASLL